MKHLQGIVHIVKQGGLWLATGHALTILGQFIVLKIIAVYGSNILFGQFAIVLMILTGLQILLYGPLTQWAIRHFQEYLERGRVDEYLVVIQVLVASIGVFVLLVTGLFSLYFDESEFFRNIGFSLELILFSLVFGVLSCINELMASIFNAAAQPIKAALFFIFGTWLRVVAVIIVIQIGYVSIDQIVLWIIIFQLLLFLVQFRSLLSLKKNRANKTVKIKNIISHLLKMRNYMVPFIVWGIPAYVALMGDRWLLAKYTDIVTLAVYSAMAISTFGVANAVGVAINKAVAPMIFRLSGSGKVDFRKNLASKLLNNLSTIMVVAYSPVLLIYYLWPEVILQLFTTNRFVNYSSYLWVLMFGAIAFNLSQLLITHGLIEKCPKIYVPVKYFHGLFTVTMLYIFTPLYGVVGTIYSVTVSHFIQLFLVIMVNKFSIKKGK